MVAETADIRQRAVTLMIRSYDEVRRAISFLRWREDDMESIAPSLYAGRGTRPKPPIDNTSAGDATLVTGTPSAVRPPVVPNGANGANGQGTTPAPGMPGASPFMR